MAAAAQKLSLNQSTISHTIEKLRHALRDPLFIRVGRRIAPTDFLTESLAQVDVTIANLEALVKPREYDPTQDNTEVCVVANVQELLPLLSGLRSRVMDDNTSTKFRFLELGSRARLVETLSQPHVDLAVSVKMPNLPAELDAERLFQSDFAVFYDPLHRSPPMTVQDYAAAPHAVLDFGGSAPSTIAVKLAEMNLTRNVVLGVPNADVLGRFLRGSDMICTMQNHLATNALSGLSYIKPPFRIDPVFFDVVWHRRNSQNPKTLWLRKILNEAANGV